MNDMTPATKTKDLKETKHSDDVKYLEEAMSKKKELKEEKKEPTQFNIDDSIVKLYINNAKEDKKARKWYSIILIIILIIELVFLNVIFILVGNQILNYSETVLNIFISAGIAEIFVLIGTIVRYLFTDNLTNVLNMILGKNNKNMGAIKTMEKGKKIINNKNELK